MTRIVTALVLVLTATGLAERSVATQTSDKPNIVFIYISESRNLLDERRDLADELSDELDKHLRTIILTLSSHAFSFNAQPKAPARPDLGASAFGWALNK